MLQAADTEYEGGHKERTEEVKKCVSSAINTVKGKSGTYRQRITLMTC
jgi:hypothetical protein